MFQPGLTPFDDSVDEVDLQWACVMDARPLNWLTSRTVFNRLGPQVAAEVQYQGSSLYGGFWLLPSLVSASAGRGVSGLIGFVFLRVALSHQIPSQTPHQIQNGENNRMLEEIVAMDARRLD